MITIAASLGMAIILLATLPQPVQALPPRPTVPADSEEDPASLGAQIQLKAQFPDDWSWQTVHWQDLWTVVQWQDALGEWHAVEGWQGSLDTIKIGKDGTVVGLKTWWLGYENLGQGPVRWQVFESHGGQLLTSSDTFHLPAASKTTLEVNVLLP
jgi:hypothetical protein